MQICSNCLQELLDSDTFCDKCGYEILINHESFLKIKNQIIRCGKLRRKKLVQKYPYDKIYQYLIDKHGKEYFSTIIFTGEVVRSPDCDSIPPSKPIIECPYCHSTNTEKITTTTKVVNTVVWGIFGTKRHKEWHCNNCKSDF